MPRELRDGAGASAGPVTALLLAWAEGDESALDELTPLVHDELCRMAHRRMAHERPGHTLNTRALVNETYLRLVNVKRVRWQDRAHFFAISARLMRRILVDFARRKSYLKRGGAVVKVPLSGARVASPEKGTDLVALDEALRALAAVDARMSQVVELRFFGGLSARETSAVLEVSPDTVLRDWRLAKAWLWREMKTAAG